MTSGHNANFAAFIYAVGERSLIPFGLHHIWNVPFYYNFGDYMTKSGQLVTGDIPVFFAQLRDGVPLTAGAAVYDRSFPDHDVCVTCRRVGDVSGSKTGT